jgi:repressor LexA
MYIYTRMLQPTTKQRKILGFIEEYRKKQGISPSFQEIQAHFGYASVNSVQNHVGFLRKKGLLGSKMGAVGTKKRSLMSLLPMPLASVPLVGRIAAGVPVEAIENVETSIDLSSLGVDNSDNGYFALRVKGESMINAHILDGDLVVIKKQPAVGPHEVAAVLWNNEATLKYVRKDGERVTLVPANDAMQPRVVDEEKVEAFEVLGKVVRVIRGL